MGVKVYMIKNDNKGFTLVELIVALAVMSLLMIAVVGLMIMNTATNKRLKADSAVQSEAGELYESINDSVSQAKYIEIYAGGKVYKLDPGTGEESFKSMTDTNGYTFEKMIIKYTVNHNSDYGGTSPDGKDTCTVTYELSGDTMYVYRSYEYMTSLNDTAGTIDNNIYAQDIDSAIVKVYEDSNAMELLINYNKNERTYSSDNYVKIRNSYVIKHQN